MVQGILAGYLILVSIYMYILIPVTCLFVMFVQEKLTGVCIDQAANFRTAFFQSGHQSKGVRFFYVLRIS